MKTENEITVRVNSNYEKLNRDLLAVGFRVVKEYNLNDIYLINKEVDLLSMDTLELLKKCIILRDVVGIVKKVVYKYKKYDNERRIIEQGKTECVITNINDAFNLFSQLDYIELIRIFDRCIVYTDDKIELVVQIVNDKYIFIEMEDKAEHINKSFENIEDMIYTLSQYNIDYDKTDYFVKKAEIIFNNKYRK